jgi:uncharacterized protein with HEPN domain
MARSDDARIQDILAAVADIRADTSGLDLGAFATNPTVVRSVLYSIAVIGEAAKNISAATRTLYPDIPWRAMAASGTELSTSTSVPIPCASGRWLPQISACWRKY